MKYKNINSAIHNVGHSFVSGMNYVDGEHVVIELRNIHSKSYDIEVNWHTRKFEPAELASARIVKSIGYWADTLREHLLSQEVELEKLRSLYFKWPAGQRQFMFATDDSGKEYKIYVSGFNRVRLWPIPTNFCLLNIKWLCY